MNERIERLQSEAARLGVVKGGRRDGLYQTLGAMAAVGGVVAALITYASSLGMENSLDVQSAIILALAMLGVSVVGSAVFLRYSFARFLRFWLLRTMVEGQDHIDRVVAAHPHACGALADRPRGAGGGRVARTFLPNWRRLTGAARSGGDPGRYEHTDGMSAERRRFEVAESHLTARQADG